MFIRGRQLLEGGGCLSPGAYQKKYDIEFFIFYVEACFDKTKRNVKDTACRVVWEALKHLFS